MMARFSWLLAMGLLAVGCSKKDAAGPTPAADPASAAAQPAAVAPAEAKPVAIGEAAPDFKLKELDGGEVSLSEHKGKIVVLEWFNPDCPFVKDAHGNGNLKGMAARYRDKDVVWLAINSGAAGKQGHGEEANRQGKGRYGIDYPILFDADGAVGASYGAKRTPEMYVIDRAGELVYHGALDTTGGDSEDAEGVVNYLADALEDVIGGKPVRRAESKAWGCSVKYARR